jgi:hypothetical protein
MAQLVFPGTRAIEFAPGAVFRDGRRADLSCRESRAFGRGDLHRFAGEGLEAEVTVSLLEPGAWRLDALFDAGRRLPEMDRLVLRRR